MRIQVAIAALLLCGSALAETASISWVLPTSNTDSTAIPPSGAGSLTRTTIEYGNCVGTPRAFGAKIGEMWVAPPAVTLNVAMVVVQEYCFRGFVTNTYGATSAMSNVAWKANPPPTPAGIMITVASSNAARAISTGNDAILTAQVGTVAPGTVCDCTQLVVAFNHPGKMFCRVPKASVQFFPGFDAEALVAECSG
jgi:hypothetical protein